MCKYYNGITVINRNFFRRHNMKRIVALVSLLLCVALAFGSCSLLNMSFRRFYSKTEFESAHEFTNASKVSELDTLVYEDSARHLIAFTTNDAETLKLYNVETGSVVLTLDREEIHTYDLFSVFGIPFAFVVVKSTTDDETTYSSRLYDATGTKIAEAEDTDEPAEAPEVACDFFKFDDLLYRVTEEGTVEQVSDDPLKSYLPDVDTKSKKFYYAISDDDVSVYNKDLELVYYWEVPFMAEDSEIALISDGVLYAQVFELLPEDTEDYDVLLDGEKVNVVGYVINANRKSAKEVDVDFIVDDMDECYDEIYTYAYEVDTPPARVTNLAYVYFFEDHRIDSKETLVTIQDNGKTFEIAPKYDDLPVMVAEDRFKDYRDNGEVYLINGRGKVIGNLTNLQAQFNEKFVAIDDKLYDADLELVYDAKSNDKVVYAMLSTAVILKDAEADGNGKTKYYLYTADGNTSEIENWYGSANQFYVTKNSNTGELSFYNNAGDLIVTAKGSSWSTTYTSRDGDVKLICVTDSEGKTHYYKFT